MEEPSIEYDAGFIDGLEEGKRQLQERIKKLEELLIEYGRHSPGCPKQWGSKYPCNCGWDREREQALKV